jgi:hypothetical protein
MPLRLRLLRPVGEKAGEAAGLDRDIRVVGASLMQQHAPRAFIQW